MFSMFSVSDFIRKTRAPRKRLAPPREDPFKTFLLSPHVLIGGALFLLSLTLGVFILMRAADWDKKTQFGFVVVSGKKEDVARPLTLVSVNGEEHTAVIMPLPDALMIETLSGYGQYKAASLQGLATLEHQPYTFITQSLALQFGIDLRGVIWIKETPQNLPKNLSQTLTAATLGSLLRSTLFFGQESTLRAIDRYALWQFFRALRKDQVTTLDTLSSAIVVPKGSTFLYDPMRADPIIFQLFSDTKLRKEDKTIAVVNATNEPRLGTRVARALANMGASITNVSTAPEEMAYTTLTYADASIKNSLTGKVILRTLNLSKEALVNQPGKNTQYRADLVLFIGQDLVKFLLTN